MECNKDEVTMAPETSEKGHASKLQKSTTPPLTRIRVKIYRARMLAKLGKLNTFWTVCNNCRVHYEYERVYLNEHLLCPNCQRGFLAVDTGPPTRGIKMPSSWSSSQVRAYLKRQVTGQSDPNAEENMATTSSNGAESHNSNNDQTHMKTVKLKHCSLHHVTCVKLKREREEGQSDMEVEKALQGKVEGAEKGCFDPAKRRREMKDTGLIRLCNAALGETQEMNDAGGVLSSCKSNQGVFEFGKVSGITETSSAKEVSQVEFQNLPMGMAINEITMRLRDLKADADDNQKANEEGGKHGNFESGKISGITKTSSEKEVSQVEFQNLPMGMAIDEISTRLRDLKANADDNQEANEEGGKEN